jgi:hypothetical protein
MGSQGIAKGMKTENLGQVEKQCQVVVDFHEFPSGQHFFH